MLIHSLIIAGSAFIIQSTDLLSLILGIMAIISNPFEWAHTHTHTHTHAWAFCSVHLKGVSFKQSFLIMDYYKSDDI